MNEPQMDPEFRAAAASVRNEVDARALVRKTVQALVAAGRRHIDGREPWVYLIPHTGRRATRVAAWMRADAAMLGGAWVKSQQIKSGRGAFGRLGGSGLRARYAPGHLSFIK